MEDHDLYPLRLAAEAVLEQNARYLGDFKELVYKAFFNYQPHGQLGVLPAVFYESPQVFLAAVPEFRHFPVADIHLLLIEEDFRNVVQRIHVKFHPRVPLKYYIRVDHNPSGHDTFLILAGCSAERLLVPYPSYGKREVVFSQPSEKERHVKRVYVVPCYYVRVKCV